LDKSLRSLPQSRALSVKRVEMKNILVLFLLLSSQISEGNTKSGVISGSYLIGPATQYDAHPNEPITHFRFEITGESAKNLFESISSEPTINKGCVFENDGCFEYQVKTLGEVMCTLDLLTKSYICSFALNLKTETLVKSAPLKDGDV
jgi:hypothetical protein